MPTLEQWGFEAKVGKIVFPATQRIREHISSILCFIAENPGRIELSNKDRKNRPMQQEDEYRIQMELNRYLRKETLPVGTKSDLSFYEAGAARTPSSRGE